MVREEKALITRRVYVSVPGDPHLRDEQKALKWAIINRIKEHGYIPEMFFSPQKPPGLTTNRPWNGDNVYAVARRCVGAVILGLRRWRLAERQFATEYCHYEGAVAYTLGLPLLIVAEQGIEPRVLFSREFGYVTWISPDKGLSGLDDDEFNANWAGWKNEVDHRRDVFLGYCSSSAGPANNIRGYLKSEVEATVLDWKSGFVSGSTIIDQVANAARRCSAGVFLFTRDDKLPTEQEPDQVAPRDNVVFEAGYFAHAKGNDRVLIIRERGAKMPTDLGGLVYVTLEDRANIEPIKEDIRRFLQLRL